MMAISNEQGTQSRTRQLLLAWGPAIVWMVAIFFFSSQSSLGGMKWPPIYQALRKSAHIAEYAGLALLVGRALIITRFGAPRAASRSVLRRAWWLGSIVTTLYAMTDEFHQSFVPNRGAHWGDVLIDLLSAVAALGIFYIWQTRSRATAVLTPELEKK
jgi:VanZ family protein